MRCFLIGWAQHPQVSQELRCDRRTVLLAVTNDGLALAHAAAPLQDEVDVVRSAVLQNGTALEFASLRMQDTNEIAMSAVRQTARAFQHVSPRLRDMRPIASAAVFQQGFGVKAFGFASERLRGIRSFVVEAIAKHGVSMVTYSVPRLLMLELCDNLHVMTQAIRVDEGALEYASDRLRSENCELVDLAVALHGRRQLQHAPARLQEKYDFQNWECEVDEHWGC